MENRGKRQVKESNLKETRRSLRLRLEGHPIQKRPVLDEVTNKTEDIEANKSHQKPFRKSTTKSSPEDFYKSALDRSSSSDPSFSTPECELEEDGQRLPPGVVDFDEECQHDFSSCAVYAADIFKYLKEREVFFIVPYYMHNQREITKLMRCIVVDWLVEVQQNFALNHESLYLAVKLMDMFLSKKQVSKDLLQLAGVTCMLIASKFDDRFAPNVDDFLYICDNAYDKPQMIAMEKKILQTVDFNLGAPLSYSFLRRYARCSRLQMDMLTLARYILELSLVEYEFSNQPDSILAAAALSLALRMKRQSWNPTLEYYSGYSESELRAMEIRMHKHVVDAHVKLTKTVVDKYSERVFYEVAKIPALKDF